MIRYYYYEVDHRAMYYKVTFDDVNHEKDLMTIEVDDEVKIIPSAPMTRRTPEYWKSYGTLREIPKEMWDYQLLIAYGFI